MAYFHRRYLSLCKAIDVFSTRCDNISIPMKDGPYDLIVDAKGVISRIKVLRTECKSYCGSYVVALRKGGKKTSFVPWDCEFLFVDTPIGNFLIPTAGMLHTTSLSLDSFKQFLIP